MVRLIIILSVFFTSITAMLIGIHSIFFDDGLIILNVIKTAICIVVLSVGILTLLYIKSSLSGSLTERMLSVGSFTIIALGFAAILWTLFLGQKTGDFEWWAIPVNLVLILQGILAVIYFHTGMNDKLMSRVEKRKWVDWLMDMKQR